MLWGLPGLPALHAHKVHSRVAAESGISFDANLQIGADYAHSKDITAL